MTNYYNKYLKYKYKYLYLLKGGLSASAYAYAENHNTLPQKSSLATIKHDNSDSKFITQITDVSNTSEKEPVMDMSNEQYMNQIIYVLKKPVMDHIMDHIWVYYYISATELLEKAFFISKSLYDYLDYYISDTPIDLVVNGPLSKVLYDNLHYLLLWYNIIYEYNKQKGQEGGIILTDYNQTGDIILTDYNQTGGDFILVALVFQIVLLICRVIGSTIFPNDVTSKSPSDFFSGYGMFAAGFKFLIYIINKVSGDALKTLNKDITNSYKTNFKDSETLGPFITDLVTKFQAYIKKITIDKQCIINTKIAARLKACEKINFSLNGSKLSDLSNISETSSNIDEIIKELSKEEKEKFNKAAKSIYDTCIPDLSLIFEIIFSILLLLTGYILIPEQLIDKLTTMISLIRSTFFGHSIFAGNILGDIKIRDIFLKFFGDIYFMRIGEKLDDCISNFLDRLTKCNFNDKLQEYMQKSKDARIGNLLDKKLLDKFVANRTEKIKSLNKEELRREAKLLINRN